MRKLQQGDVIMRKIRDVPEEARRVPRTTRGFVLAKGEVTGHAHVIEDDIEMYEKDGVLYIKTSRPVTVRHEEHRAITLQRGTYAIGIVRECDPIEEALLKKSVVRRVGD